MSVVEDANARANAPLRASVIRAETPTKELRARWVQIQTSNPRLSSPFFSHQFTETVARVRDDVRIAVLERDNQVVGFFPFHRGRFGLARPIGLGLSDYHGVIIESEVEWSGEQLLAECGVVRWKYDHLIAGQSGLLSSVRDWQPSPIIRVDQGFDAYQRNLDGRGRKQLKEAQRKEAKLEADHGPVRFVVHTESTDVLDQMFRWKSQKCRQSGVTDFFSLEWTQELIRRLHSIQDSDFRGVLSCLYAGDQLAAVHFGIRTDRVWHYWFPGYSSELSAYSPGLILLYALINAAASSGSEYIDLGKGISKYKQRVMNDQIVVADGCAQRPSLMNRLIDCSQALQQADAGTWMHSVLKVPVRVMRRIERSRQYR